MTGLMDYSTQYQFLFHQYIRDFTIIIYYSTEHFMISKLEHDIYKHSLRRQFYLGVTEENRYFLFLTQAPNEYDIFMGDIPLTFRKFYQTILH